jgi:hypothetical protein
VGPLETSIQSNLSDYLDGHTSFADFSAWMYRTILSIDQHGDREAAELGYSIMLALAEFDSGVLSLPEFQRELLALAADGQTAPVARGSSAAAS